MIVRLAVVLLMLLVPAGWLAWTWRTMPQLGFYHDDGIYWVSAKSLAESGSYRIDSLPNRPYQTKYPPLFPLLLALVWKVSPSFPANLPLATLAVWLCFPIYALLVYLVLKRYGYPWLTALAVLNPFAVLLSFSLMPELLFTSLFLGAILAARSRPALAGVLTGLAYLTKSAALPLLIVLPLFVRPRWKFLVAALPAAIAWHAWQWSHLQPGHDLVTLYYTNYAGFQAYNVPFQDLPLVVWRNLDALLMGIGKLLTFDVAFFESVHLERLVAIGAFAGVIRLARRTRSWEYLAVGLGFALMLLVWHYQPDQRFVFPLYTLLLAGLWTELDNIIKMVRQSWQKERAVAVGIAGVLALFFLFVVGATLSGLFSVLPNLMSAYRQDLNSRMPAYQWLTRSARPDEAIFAYDDPVAFLYTGREACGVPVPTRLLYHDDNPGINRLLDTVPDFARQQHLTYLLLSRGDFYRDLHADRALRLFNAAAAAPGVERVFHLEPVEIFAVH